MRNRRCEVESDVIPSIANGNQIGRDHVKLLERERVLRVINVANQVKDLVRVELICNLLIELLLQPPIVSEVSFNSALDDGVWVFYFNVHFIFIITLVWLVFNNLSAQ